jgi:hypothetical protein
MIGGSSSDGGIFLFTKASRPALESTQSPIQGVPGALSLGVKRPVRETDHSPPSSSKVNNGVVLSQSAGTTLPLLLPEYKSKANSRNVVYMKFT